MSFRFEVCVPAVCQQHLWDSSRRRLLELCDADWWEGGGSEVLPVPLWDERPGLLLQLQKCLQKELLLHWLLQQRDPAPIPRYSPHDATNLRPLCLFAFTIFLVAFWSRNNTELYINSAQCGNAAACGETTWPAGASLCAVCMCACAGLLRILWLPPSLQRHEC